LRKYPQLTIQQAINQPDSTLPSQVGKDILKQLKVTPKIVLRLRWIGTIYDKLNDTPKALHNLESALEIYQQLGSENDIQEIHRIISRLNSKERLKG